jgi:hypothetical protein
MPVCGFPINGTEVQKEIFYHQLEARKSGLKDLHQKMYNSRVTLWIIAGITFLFGLISYFMDSTTEGALIMLILNVVISIVFLLIGSWAAERPFSALVLGLVLYVGLLLYWISEGQTRPAAGIIGRIVIIGFLIKGISSAREAEELKKEIDKARGLRK